MGIRNLFRRQKQAKRNYAAAQVSRLTSDWITANYTANQELRYTLSVLRARSRELCRNNDYARRYMGMVKSNIIGQGIHLQAMTKMANGNLDTADNRAIEDAWKTWGKKGICTVDGRMCWHDAQRMIIETIARDGEILIRYVTGAQARNDFGFAVQLIESDHLDERHNDTMPSGNNVEMGVEIDRFKRPVAYHLLTEHPGSRYADSRTERMRIDAREILHPFIVERPSQSRGVPWMTTAMLRLQMLGGYEEAELVAARTSAAKMGFFYSPDGDGFTGEGETSGGELLTDAEPGTFHQLPGDLRFEAYDPTHPTSQFEAFEKAILRGIASGLNVSYNSLANDLSEVNYSSIRHGTLEERDQWRMLQHWFVEQVCWPIYENWLRFAINTEALPIPARNIEKAMDISWQPRGWAWVDPAKEIAANAKAILYGLKSRSDVLREQGKDLEDTFIQLKIEKELAALQGIAITEAKENEITETNATSDD